ncbi:MAG TPA: ATP-dependent Clp protease adaptor ClpS, partial [bacterium]|nr:ATP-dependent Clp protease adaptor ClpS [bacterium]
MGNNPATGPLTGVKTRDEARTKEPSLYRVLLHNDDFTTMDFVVQILVQVFQRSAAEATQLMLDVHHKGVGTAGVYTYDIAMSKVIQAHQLAEEHRFPLRCTVEK